VKKILAIIPARGGSKRLPRKNVLPLGEKPLIGWTIDEAKQSKYITDIVVSTDNAEVAKVASQFGCPVPFMRPQNLSDDNASSVDVVIHAVEFFKKQLGKEYDYVLLLQPTSPLRNVSDIDSAIEMLFEKNADSVVSVCECEHSPLWTNTLPENLSMANFIREEHRGIRSQDLPKYYRLNGALYLTKVNRFLEEKCFAFSSKTFAFIMTQAKSVDIDNEIDFQLASLLFKS